MTAKELRPHMDLLDGARFDLLDGDGSALTLEAMAAGLVSTSRYRGQTPGRRITVAQHQVFVASLIPMELGPLGKLAALIHDGHEFALGDFITPALDALTVLGGYAARDAFVRLKAHVDRAVLHGFGFPDGFEWRPEIAMAVERADAAAFVSEFHAFMHADADRNHAADFDGLFPLQSHLIGDIWEPDHAAAVWSNWAFTHAHMAHMRGPIMKKAYATNSDRPYAHNPNCARFRPLDDGKVIPIRP